jgi:integrase
VLDRRAAYNQLTRILMHNGGRLAGITLGDCIEAYRAQIGYSARQHSHWYLLLRQAAILSADSPPSIWAASRRGQLTVEELVDGYDVVCQPVRNLLVDYLHERQAGMDYTSVRKLASKLVLLFWRDLELNEPGIDSLHLPDAVARRWKERLRHVRYGNHRVGTLREDPNAILMAVRAFYADLAAWALEDPARWAEWAAPNPISGRDLLGQNKQKKRATARMHQRIRELAPVLPALVEAADRQRRHTGGLLAAAQQVSPRGEFAIDNERLKRVSLVTDPSQGGNGRPGVIYAAPPEGGPRRNLTLEEDDAFWAWAVVEVLRHTGVRIEEMLELTHRSFVAYTLPTTGEVIPLLQVTPSKTDRERLLVVSPDLAEVLSAIISRVRGDAEQLPLVTRYDQAERLHSPFLPFLFQRPWGLKQQILTHHRVKLLLDRTVTLADLAGPDRGPLRFTPHDFRRIFATEAVATGLPVHIAAKLLGHESLTTTQAYIAVYDQDVIDHHRAFIARRRTLRPSQEYREPTDAEWEEFLSHFERRKVELGICGRAYGTRCEHEHACIRCPLLRAEPAQLDRLVEILDNLNARLAEARVQGWLGEVEGLQITIASAEQKLGAMQRAVDRKPLGRRAGGQSKQSDPKG